MSPKDEWPFSQLDVTTAGISGFRPRAFREFVLKVHQRCNLACDYCYVYTMGDETWHAKPATMTRDIWKAAAGRIAEHASTHDLTEVRIVLHGGEPLLAGIDRLLTMVEDVQRALPAGCRLRTSLQTNGVLLNEPTLQVLLTSSVEVGVSLDGTPEDNDRHRRWANGRGSHDTVAGALRLLSLTRYRPAFAGLLCTVDVDADPVECYEALLRHSPPTIDFLLPHGNWSRPPPRPAGRSPTPYGDWLVAVFDRWFGAPQQETRIRLLEELINLTLGGASRSEHLGLSPVAVAVIESDGSIEQVDSLKSAYPGASATGLHLFTNSFDEALTHPGIMARQLGRAALCETCLACPVHQICGAGHYAHRYKVGSGFLNPSVYCADLTRLITHVQRRLATEIRARVTGKQR